MIKRYKLNFQAKQKSRYHHIKCHVTIVSTILTKLKSPAVTKVLRQKYFKDIYDYI